MGTGSSGIPSPMLFLLLLLFLFLLPLLSVGNFLYGQPGWLDFHHFSELWRKTNRNFHPIKKNLVKTHHSQKHWPQQSRTADKNKCHGEYDIYFVLDMSGSVKGNWMAIYQLVEDLVEKFQNPKTRLSFILYSTSGNTVLKLTSDKKLIAEGLRKLQDVVPEGATHMQAGLRMAYYQILGATNGGICCKVLQGCQMAGSGLSSLSPRGKIPIQSLILTLTDGALDPTPFEESKEEAEKSRKLGASVYALGIKSFRREQLDAIADSKKHVFTVEKFGDLKTIVDPLTKKTCIEITSIEASSYCAGGVQLFCFDQLKSVELGPGGGTIGSASTLPYLMTLGPTAEGKLHSDEAALQTLTGTSYLHKPNTSKDYILLITGSGLTSAKEKDVVCRFNFGATEFIDRRATTLTDDNIKCPGVKIEKPGQHVEVQVSLDNGASFIHKTAKFTSKQCGHSSVSIPFNPLYLAIAGAGLLVLLFLFYVAQRWHKRPVKEKKPILVPCVQRPIVVVPYCECEEERMKQMEGKLDTLCHLAQLCNQMPLAVCESEEEGYFPDPLESECAQMTCLEDVCLESSQEVLPGMPDYDSPCPNHPPLYSEEPRMLPYISLSAEDESSLPLMPPDTDL